MINFKIDKNFDFEKKIYAKISFSFFFGAELVFTNRRNFSFKNVRKGQLTVIQEYEADFISKRMIKQQEEEKCQSI